MTADDSVKKAGSVSDLAEAARRALGEAEGAAALSDWWSQYLGRSGAITAQLRRLADLPLSERRAAGAALNRLKTELAELHQQRMAGARSVPSGAGAAAEQLDFSLSGAPSPRGSQHILTLTMQRIAKIFRNLGFTVRAGSEVETPEYNFDKLNIPESHPARDLMDTIWVDSGTGARDLLLRTHTSPVQIHALEAAVGEARAERDFAAEPVRTLSMGKCYRYEALDASHSWQFHQVEGIAIGSDVTFANLRWVFEQFAEQMFGIGAYGEAEGTVRFRCDFFPFVEPGVDVSIRCFQCQPPARPDDCSVCQRTGWIEIAGAGMVHPNVLRGVLGERADTERIQGFAFGMGVERIAMLHGGINDIRLFTENDVRFLNQFRHLKLEQMRPFQ